MAGKYIPLEKYLRGLPESQREVTLRFEQIEEILNGKLPFSAYESKKWWEHEKEGNHVNGRSWTNAGWKVDLVDLSGKWAKFIRTE
ncbi:hypothetical protein [Candidatus Villigracilis affinis]|uniref:DUF7662 domain-containing protein n=1 Tax=Candidatus Villigracilis affinis TaxID=3140682 RepID=UPI001DD311AE|nr:hypothetical protein [Anaerolineales bacterium]